MGALDGMAPGYRRPALLGGGLRAYEVVGESHFHGHRKVFALRGFGLSRRGIGLNLSLKLVCIVPEAKKYPAGLYAGRMWVQS